MTIIPHNTSLPQTFSIAFPRIDKYGYLVVTQYGDVMLRYFLLIEDMLRVYEHHNVDPYEPLHMFIIDYSHSDGPIVSIIQLYIYIWNKLVYNIYNDCMLFIHHYIFSIAYYIER